MPETAQHYSRDEGFHILDQLEDILDHDPLIDELGYIHPSQLFMLNEEAESDSLSFHRQESDVQLGAEVSGAVVGKEKNVFFWNRDHKLGILIPCLLPLYKAAKQRFMDSLVRYKKLDFSLKNDDMLNIEHKVMKHSKALLLLSSDFGTAWNARKLILSKSGEFSISDELALSSLILSFAPKSENAWSYRRWVIKRGAGWCANKELLLEKESKFVEKIAEKSKMNYRAWNHRCWLISYMTSHQVVQELTAIKTWASLHVADSSCFHYRRQPHGAAAFLTYLSFVWTYLSYIKEKLLLRMLCDTRDEKDTVACSSVSLGRMWEDELEWNEGLIRRYIGREALWLHRRFLSLCWIKNVGADKQGISLNSSAKENANTSVSVFMNRELDLLQYCLSLPDTEFEDTQSQALHSATYILYLFREISCLSDVNLNHNQKFGADELMKVLSRHCPQKAAVWDYLMLNHSGL